MTVTTNPSRNEYTATAGQTVFSYGFRVYDATDIDVYLTPAGQSADDSADIISAYTVTDVDNVNGGTIVLDSGAAAGDLITVVSGIPYNRETNYINNGDFKPATVNADIDRVVSQVKQKADRSLFFPESLQGVLSGILPVPVDNDLLAWDGEFGKIKNKNIAAGPGIAKSDNGSTITISALSGSSGFDGNVYKNLSVALADDGDLGDVVRTAEYFASSGVGGATYKIVAGSTGIPDGGSYIDKTDGSGYQLEYINTGDILLSQWGVVEVQTDQSAQINAAIVYSGTKGVVGSGTFYVSSPVSVAGGQSLEGTGGLESLEFIALDDFVGEAVVLIEGTRGTVRNIDVSVPASLYDPATNTGTQVNGIQTKDRFFHAVIENTKVAGGYRAYYGNSLEGKFIKCQAVDAYDGFYFDEFDNYVSNITTTDCSNIGLYSDAGVEGTNVHLVRAGEIAMSLFNQVPNQLTEVFIDTPAKIGVRLSQVNGSVFNGIYFTKVGEGTALTTDVFYFQFVNSSNNRFMGNAVTKGTVDQTAKYFIEFNDSADDTVLSRNNTFENFILGDLSIATNNGQRGAFLRQRVINCSGEEIARYENGSILYRSPGYGLADTETQEIKAYLRAEFNTNAAFVELLSGRYVFRSDTNDRQVGRFIITLPSTDTSVSQITRIPEETIGAAVDYDDIDFTNVTYDYTNNVLTFDIENNSGAGSGAFATRVAITIDGFLDSLGSYLG